MKALLAIWSDAAIQSQLDGTTRNNKVFKRISDELNARGIPDKTPPKPVPEQTEEFEAGI